MGKANRAYRRRVYQRVLKSYMSGLPLDEVIPLPEPPKQPWWSKVADVILFIISKYFKRRG